MKKMFEVVRTLDVEPFDAGEGDAFRFRLEVARQLGADVFEGKVYRLETYRLQPTFPQMEGGVPDWKNDGLIYVVDEMFDVQTLRGTSADEVVQKFLQALGKIFESN